MASLSMTNEAFLEFVFPAINVAPRSAGEAMMSVQVLDKFLPLTQDVQTGVDSEDNPVTRKELIADPTVVELEDREVEFLLRRLEQQMRSRTPDQLRPILPVLTALEGEFSAIIQNQDSQVRVLNEAINAKIGERNQLDAEIAERRRVRDELPTPGPEPSNGPVRT